MLAANLLSCLYRRCFTAEKVNNRQSPELLGIDAMIVNEVKAPSLIHALWIAARLTMDNHLAPTWSFAAKGQAFLAIEPVD
jgi:hypothetical protein